MIEAKHEEVSKGDKRIAVSFLRGETVRRVIAEALYQVQVESDNVLRSASFSDPGSLENAQRAQGRVGGAQRLIELLFEVEDEEDEEETHG